MSGPTVPVPSAQQERFQLALADYLGIDPTRWVLDGWTVDPDGGRVRLTAHVPGDVLLALFNTGEVPPADPG